jgi:hypothetical protein
MVESNDDSIDHIDSHEEQNFAKHRFKNSLQVPNHLWKFPTCIILDYAIATPEGFLIWNQIKTVRQDNRYSMNFHKTDVTRILPDDIQGELE